MSGCFPPKNDCHGEMHQAALVVTISQFTQIPKIRTENEFRLVAAHSHFLKDIINFAALIEVISALLLLLQLS